MGQPAGALHASAKRSLGWALTEDVHPSTKRPVASQLAFLIGRCVQAIPTSSAGTMNEIREL
ncbi:MAG TPA: hypothetical protein VHP33_02340 [Polyangiaceae bacterium]|nr:hypothetical protein [Polyangiaceae bacterium]